MDDYHKRKQERAERYQRAHGRKLVPCGACNGSGYYDHNGSPPCDACNGTGKVREPVRTPKNGRPALISPRSDERR